MIVQYVAACLISLLIFSTALFAHAKKWFGVSSTLIVLLFGLFTGITISNQDIIRNFLAETFQFQQQDHDLKTHQLHEQVLRSYDLLKSEMELQKHKVQILSEEIQQIKSDNSDDAT